MEGLSKQNLEGSETLGLFPGISWKEALVLIGLLCASPLLSIFKMGVTESPTALGHAGVFFSIGANAVGAALGMSLIAQTTSGASIKKPKVGSKALLGIIVCEANIVFGVIQTIILNTKMSELPSSDTLHFSPYLAEIFHNSYVAFFSGLIAGLCGLASSIGTGIVSSASIMAIASDPAVFSKLVTLQLIVSGVGPFGLIMAIMLLQVMVPIKLPPS